MPRSGKEPGVTARQERVRRERELAAALASTRGYTGRRRRH